MTVSAEQTRRNRDANPFAVIRLRVEGANGSILDACRMKPRLEYERTRVNSTENLSILMQSGDIARVAGWQKFLSSPQLRGASLY
jgi:hypothetical protein